MGGQPSPEWVGLEERVCAAGPFDASAILPNHAQYVALIAGFGLAGFILLLDRGHDSVEGDRERGHTNGALLLALSAVVGLVSGYMFSAVTGDHCLNTQVEFGFPSALLVITALLLVAGISVAAASQRQLGDTATALRGILVLVTLLAVVRIGADYTYADQVSRGYERFTREVARLERASAAPPSERLEAGSIYTIDRQLGRYASAEWPGREPEWPSLLAQLLFDSEPSATATGGIWIVGACALALAVCVRWRMRHIKGLGFTGTASDTSTQAERWWRVGVSVLTVTATLVAVGMFSILPYDRLMRPEPVVWLTLFGIVAFVAALLVQPPLVGNQRSMFAATGRIRERVRRRPETPAS